MDLSEESLYFYFGLCCRPPASDLFKDVKSLRGTLDLGISTGSDPVTDFDALGESLCALRRVGLPRRDVVSSIDVLLKVSFQDHDRNVKLVSFLDVFVFQLKNKQTNNNKEGSSHVQEN